MPQDHWLHSFNYNLEEWDAENAGDLPHLAFARAVFKEAHRREAVRPLHYPQPYPRRQRRLAQSR
jgi:hypothetical protein